MSVMAREKQNPAYRGTVSFSFFSILVESVLCQYSTPSLELSLFIRFLSLPRKSLLSAEKVFAACRWRKTTDLSGSRVVGHLVILSKS